MNTTELASELNVDEVTYDAETGEMRISRMYEYVSLTPRTLAIIAEHVGHDRIDIGDKESEGGCTSCDWGSCYTVTLHIR